MTDEIAELVWMRSGDREGTAAIFDGPHPTPPQPARVEARLYQAWDQGHRQTIPHGDHCEPDCPNPYLREVRGEVGS